MLSTKKYTDKINYVLKKNIKKNTWQKKRINLNVKCYVKKELHSKKNKKRERGDIMVEIEYSCKKQEKPLCWGLLVWGGYFW